MGDLGTSLSAKTLLSAAFGRDVLGEMRAVAHAAQRDLFVCSVGTVALTAILAWFPGWNHFITTDATPLQYQMHWAATVLAFAAGATILTSLGPALAAAAQLTWALNLASALGGVLTLATVMIGAWFDLPWIVFISITLTLPVVVNLVLYAITRHQLGWKGVNAERLGRQEVREMRRLARWFLIPHAGSLFMQSGIQIALATTGGTSAAAAYNVIHRIFGLISQVHWMAIAPLWPAYAEAQARGDYIWMRTAYTRSFLVTLGVFVPGLALTASLTPQLAAFWTGNPIAELTPILIGVTAFWFGLQLIGQPPATLLNGLGRIRGVARYGTMGHGVSLVCMSIAGMAAGAPGVVVGMTAGYALVGLPATLVEASRAVRQWPR